MYYKILIIYSNFFFSKRNSVSKLKTFTMDAKNKLYSRMADFQGGRRRVPSA